MTFPNAAQQPEGYQQPQSQQPAPAQPQPQPLTSLQPESSEFSQGYPGQPQYALPQQQSQPFQPSQSSGVFQEPIGGQSEAYQQPLVLQEVSGQPQPLAQPQPQPQYVTPQPSMPQAVPFASVLQPPPAAVPPGMLQPKKPLSSAQRLVIILVSIVVGVIVLLAVLYAVLSSTVFSAKTYAENYLSAISSGQYAKANSLANPNIENAQGVLLSNAAAQKQKIRMSNVNITGVNNNTDGSAVVNFSYTLANRSYRDSVTLQKQGSQFLIFKGWAISTPLLKEISFTANAAAGISQFLVNGISINEKNAIGHNAHSDPYVIKVYPGVYTVTVAKSVYVSSNTLTLDATASHPPTSQQLKLSATTKLKNDIFTQVDAALKQCEKSTDLSPVGCPFSYFTYGRSDSYSNISWTITQFPNTIIFDLENGMFESYDYGAAKITYDYRLSSLSSSSLSGSYTDYFYIMGSFTIDGDKLTVKLDSSY